MLRSWVTHGSHGPGSDHPNFIHPSGPGTGGNASQEIPIRDSVSDGAPQEVLQLWNIYKPSTLKPLFIYTVAFIYIYNAIC